jgi:hypothetical protein
MMRKYFTFPLFLVSAVSVLMAAESENLLSNGSFEPGSWGAATYGWAKGVEVNSTDAAATWNIDSVSATAKDGKSFLRINVTNVTDQNWHVQLKDPSWKAKPNFIYHFSMWARADSARSATISVYGSQDYLTGSNIELTTEWKQYHQKIISDVDGMNMINFAFVVGSSIGVYDLDGVVITEEENTAGNLYSNGDFEVDGAGWTLYTDTSKGDSSTGLAAITYPAEGAKSGTKFARVTVTGLPTENWEIQLQDGSWTTELDAEYTYTFWAKADHDDAMIHIAAQAGSSRKYEYISGRDFTLSQTWEEQSYTFTALGIGGKDSVSFNIYCGSALGKYDFDNISLSKVSSTATRSALGTSKKVSQQFAVRVLPGQLQCTLNDDALVNKIQIHDLQGRLFYSQSMDRILGKSYNLPRPPSGTYIIRVNSNRTVENQMIVLP